MIPARLDAAPAFPPMPTAEPHGRLGRVAAITESRLTGVLRDGDDGMAPAVGALVKIHTPESRIFGIVSAVRTVDPAAATATVVVDIEMVCEALDAGDGGRLRRGVSIYPALGADIFAAGREETALIYGADGAGGLAIGTLQHDPSLTAMLSLDGLLERHFAVLGTTGAGKSCAVALIARAIIAAHANARIVLLDPHGEYGAAFGERAEVLDAGSMYLPYWLLDFETLVAIMVSHGAEREAESAILRGAVLHAKHAFATEHGGADRITVDTPIPYRFGDFIQFIDVEMGKLDKPESTAPYMRLKARLDSLRGDRRYACMFSGIRVRDEMPAVLSRLLRLPVDGKPITVVDLSGLPAEIFDAVASVVCRLIFDFAQWNPCREGFHLLLLCEDAHRYVPERESADPGPTMKAITRIAAEGRKLGIALGIVSARPSEVAVDVLSQCNTLVALRLNSERDHAFVRNVLPASALGLVEALPTLKPREAVIVGDGVSVPMHMRFADLAPEARPQAAMLAFSEAWTSDIADPATLIPATIDRWRRQRR